MIIDDETGSDILALSSSFETPAKRQLASSFETPVGVRTASVTIAQLGLKRRKVLCPELDPEA